MSRLWSALKSIIVGACVISIAAELLMLLGMGITSVYPALEGRRAVDYFFYGFFSLAFALIIGGLLGAILYTTHAIGSAILDLLGDKHGRV